jgi:polysaccharide pyruvyl transferase WcaK-like protein
VLSCFVGTQKLNFSLLRAAFSPLRHTRLQVSQLFDESNYDVACVLRHLPLLVRLYAETEQGRENIAYYLTLSQQICVYIGAVNDENHLITLKMLSIYERLDIDDKIAAALSQPRVRHSFFPIGRIVQLVRVRRLMTERVAWRCVRT